MAQGINAVSLQVPHSHHVPPDTQGRPTLQERQNQQGLETEIVCAQWKEALLLQRRGECVYVCSWLPQPSYHCSIQNHSPAGTVELKEIRNVSDLLEDGTFQVHHTLPLCCIHYTRPVQIVTPDRVYDIRGGE